MRYNLSSDLSFDIGDTREDDIRWFRSRIERIRIRVDEIVRSELPPRLPGSWRAAWTSFVRAWGGFLAEHRDPEDRGKYFFAENAHVKLNKFETDLAKLRLAFDRAGGSPSVLDGGPAASMNARAVRLRGLLDRVNSVLNLHQWTSRDGEAKTRWVQTLDGFVRLYPPMTTPRHWIGSNAELGAYERAADQWMAWAQQRAGQQATTMRRRY